MPRQPLLRRLPIVGIVLTIVVLVSALFDTPPVRDAATGGRVGEVMLQMGPGYLAFAPLWDVLDALTLLSVRDHIALLVWLIVVYVAWRILRRRVATTPVRKRREAGLATLALVLLFLVYAFGALAPRPMAQLAVTIGEREQVLAVDVHAHTRYSHDGRPGWTPEDVREWHRSAGFDAAYISDHRTFEGVERGYANNPVQAGQGTMLLPAIEVVWNGEHVNILNAGLRFRGLTTESLRDVDEEALKLASSIEGAEPVLVYTIPGNLDHVVAAPGSGTAGERAIEVIDGAPRGLGQSRRERQRILRIADSLDLALVAGSNNHGWGRTASGWTLLRIPGWRGMGADSLALHIDRVLREGRRQATRVVERVGGTGDGPLAVAFALPVIAWRMFTTLSGDQRTMWIIWTWVIVIAARFLRTRRRRAAAA
jgi:predicted metal-dependent phosphoesterase TrpH